MIGERVLRALCRPPETGDYDAGLEHEVIGHELALLRREFPGFSALVRGKRVADVGCGTGGQAMALVLEEGCEVFGIDTNRSSLARARRRAQQAGITRHQLMLVEHVDSSHYGTFDVVISQNSMEHFADPAAVLAEMRRLVRPDGAILVTFGPPWFAPYGAHMHFFCRVPWVNLLFPEATVLAVRRAYRSDGATRYEDVESGLNRMSVARFERLLASGGLRVQDSRYTCVRRLDWAARLPLLRELLINQVSCRLVPDALPQRSEAVEEPSRAYPVPA